MGPGKRIALDVRLPAPPEVVWPFLVEPERFGDWSRATMRVLDPGDGGGAGDVGALRRIGVRALGRNVAFDEVIVRSEPPYLLGYRVYRGLPLRRHRGEIRLDPIGDGATHLRWDVDFEFYLPGAGALARRLLEGQLRDSLEALGRAVPGAAPVVFPVRRAMPDADLGALSWKANAVLAEQRDLADELKAGRDPKYWFARVYQYVTEAQLALLETGEVLHADWVLRIIPAFHRYFVDNLRSWRAGARAEVEGPWQRAYRVMERGAGRRQGTTIVRGMLLGVYAHIEEDLPRALADVWVRHYRNAADYVRFRGDYLSMGNVFREASERLLAQMPRDFVPAYLRLLRAALPPEVPEAIIQSRYYDVPARRRLAFERGRRLAALLAEVARNGGADDAGEVPASATPRR